MRQRIAETKYSSLAGVSMQVDGAVQPATRHNIDATLHGAAVVVPSDCVQAFQQFLDRQHGGVVLRIGIIVKSVQIIALCVRSVVAEGHAVGV